MKYEISNQLKLDRTYPVQHYYVLQFGKDFSWFQHLSKSSREICHSPISLDNVDIIVSYN